MTASLPMYPIAGLRRSTEALWEVIAGELGTGKSLAPWTAPTDDLWLDPGLVVSQTCGWPLITELAGQVRVIGSFSYRTPTWHGAEYESVILSTTAGRVDGRAAVNSLRSLSGWLSLVWALGGRPADLVLTGSHIESLRALQSGTAEIASIDAVTVAYLERADPGLFAGLHVVGRGPAVPTLPLITSAGTTDIDIARLRAAVAVGSRSSAAGHLLIDGFVERDEADYVGLRELEPQP